MVELNIMEIKHYKKLFPHEYHAISEFYNGGNRKPLVKLLTGDSAILLSDGIRQFIADVIMEKVKPHRRDKFDRDYLLFKEVEEEMNKNPLLKLTSNAKSKGAATIVASKQNGLTEEVVLEAYRKINNTNKEMKNNY